MDSQKKLKLLPATVPWQIDPGAPYLTLQKRPGTEEPLSATFIAYFKCDELSKRKNASPEMQVISTPPEFRAHSLEEKVPFRLVRVYFREGHSAQMKRAVADHEVIRESDYDWSAVQSSPKPQESVDQTVRRSHELWVMTGICPNSRMYEVENSQRPKELGLSDAAWRQYLLLGHDEYLEVIAQGWTWEAGQPIE